MPAKEVDADVQRRAPGVSTPSVPLVVSGPMQGRPMRVVVVASADLDPSDGSWLDGADQVIAADGGAGSLDRIGRRPDRLIGDLDSVEPALAGRLADAGVPRRASPARQGCLGHRAGRGGRPGGRRDGGRAPRRVRRLADRPRAREPAAARGRGARRSRHPRGPRRHRGARPPRRRARGPARRGGGHRDVAARGVGRHGRHDRRPALAARDGDAAARPVTRPLERGREQSRHRFGSSTARSSSSRQSERRGT